MTSYRAVIAERQDMATVTVMCECSASVSLKIETARVPVRCSSCGKDYDENIQAALAALGRFHREAITAEEKAGRPIFRFEVKFIDAFRPQVKEPE